MQATGNYFADLLAAREAGLVLSDLNPSKDELVALIERHNALVHEYLEPVTKVESEPELKPEPNQYQDLFSQWQAKKEQPKAQSKTQSKKQRNQALKQMAAQIAAQPAPVGPVTPVAQPAPVGPVAKVASTPVTPVTPVANKIGMALTRNTDKNGIEIRFDARPDDDTLADLKLNGFRWSRFNQCWYALESDLTLDVANAVAEKFGVDGLPEIGAQLPQSVQVATAAQPEPVQPMQAAPSYIVIADHLYQTCLPVVETPRQQLANTLASIEIDKLSEKRVEQLLAVIKAVL